MLIDNISYSDKSKTYSFSKPFATFLTNSSIHHLLNIYSNINLSSWNFPRDTHLRHITNMILYWRKRIWMYMMWYLLTISPSAHNLALIIYIKRNTKLVTELSIRAWKVNRRKTFFCVCIQEHFIDTFYRTESHGKVWIYVNYS